MTKLARPAQISTDAVYPAIANHLAEMILGLGVQFFDIPRGGLGPLVTKKKGCVSAALLDLPKAPVFET